MFNWKCWSTSFKVQYDECSLLENSLRLSLEQFFRFVCRSFPFGQLMHRRRHVPFELHYIYISLVRITSIYQNDVYCFFFFGFSLTTLRVVRRQFVECAVRNQRTIYVCMYGWVWQLSADNAWNESICCDTHPHSPSQSFMVALIKQLCPISLVDKKKNFKLNAR